jgi:hypothetical protein
LCFKTFISKTIRAFGTTVPFSRIENENLKIEQKYKHKLIYVIIQIHIFKVNKKRSHDTKIKLMSTLK